MRTTVTKRIQTVIPASIRKKYSIREGDLLEWIDDGQVIKVIPISLDPIQVLRGSARSSKLLERLLNTRQTDKQRE